MSFTLSNLSFTNFMSLSFSFHSPCFSLNSSSLALSGIGSVPFVTHLMLSFLHHSLHSVRRTPPPQCVLTFNEGLFAYIIVLLVQGFPYLFNFSILFGILYGVFGCLVVPCTVVSLLLILGILV